MLPLFDRWPAGFEYGDDFVEVSEEQELLAWLGALAFRDFTMRGVTARRRVAFFGESYPGTEGDAEPIPDFLLTLRARVGEWSGRAPDEFGMVLVNEYRAGASIGWHRDAPQYDIVAGISIGATCRMKFRPYVAGRPSPTGGPRKATHEQVLVSRSAYLMTGASRSAFEHHIPAVDALRYSITMRTFRRR